MSDKLNKILQYLLNKFSSIGKIYEASYSGNINVNSATSTSLTALTLPVGSYVIIGSN